MRHPCPPTASTTVRAGAVRRTHPCRNLAAGLLGLFALAGTACGSASPTSTTGTTTTAIVRPPAAVLQGCNYVVNGVVPPGMSQGTKPPFGAFSPDRAGITALEQIHRHGGTGLVTGFAIPAGTELYAGPDGSAAPVGTVPDGRSLLLAEPVLWTTASGRHWLATFLACGGPSLYWIDVAQVTRANPDAGATVAGSVASALASTAAPPGISAQHLVISPNHQFAWASDKLTFAIARGIYQGF
jgi:hypothetical protein